MPAEGAIKAGEAYVQLTLRDETVQGLKNVQSRLSGVGKQLTLAGAAVGGLGASVAGPLQLAVNQASDAFEGFNKFQAVFGNLSDQADKFAVALSSGVNRSAVDVRNALADFQSFFVGLKFGRQEALELSKTLTEIGIDIASFRNLSDDEAFTKLFSAIAGETEVARRLGIDLSQAAIAAELLNQGFTTTAKNATEAQKVLARVSIISRTIGQQGALGDAARTAGSYANRIKGLQAAFKDLSVAIGTPLLAARASFAKSITSIIQDLTAFISSNQQLVVAVSAVATTLTVVGAALVGMGATAIIASASLSAFGRLSRTVTAPVAAIGSAAVTAARGMYTLAAAAVGQVVAALRAVIVSSFQLAGQAMAAVFRAAVATASAFASLLVPAVLQAAGAILYFAGGAVVTTAFVAVSTLTTATTAAAAAFGVTLPAGIAGAVAAVFGFLTSFAAVPIAIVSAIGALFLFDAAALGVSQAVSVLGQTFASLANIAVATGRGIYLAFVNQDFPGLFAILGAGIKAAWFRTLAGLVGATRSLFGSQLVDVVLSVGNAIFRFVAAVAQGVYALLKPVFAVVRTILGLVGRAITAVTDFFGVTVSAAAAAESLNKSATDAQAELDALVAAQEAAKQPGANALDAIRGNIPDLSLDLEPFDPSRAREWINDIQQNLPPLDVPLDIPGIDTSALDDLAKSIKEFDIKSIFGKGGDFESALEEIQGGRAAELEERLAKIRASFGGLDGGRGGRGGRIATGASFNAALAAMQLGGGAAERTAKATEQTATNTKKLVERAGSNTWG